MGQWLSQAGLALEVVHAYRGAPLPARLDHDAIVVLGGGYLPDADHRAAWLAPTRSLVSQALEAHKPILGICLGGQMLAHVAGGIVEGDVGAPEAGSTPIRLRPEAADDPLFAGLPEAVPAMEHHVDAITKLPPDAVWLAETDRCRYQALRVGARAWGVQFHPEVTPERILTWNAHELRDQGFDRDVLHAQALADEPISTPIWHTVTNRFADVVGNWMSHS